MLKPEEWEAITTDLEAAGCKKVQPVFWKLK